MLTIFHDSHVHDPLVDVIRSTPSLRSRAELFSVEELLNGRVDEFDYLAGGEAPDALVVGDRTLRPGRDFLVNRLTRISRRNFVLFGESQDLFSCFKYSTAFLSALVARFGFRTGGPGQGCLAGNYFPLNHQWYCLRQQIPGLITPEFVYGFGYSTPDYAYTRPVSCDPNDLASLLDPDADRAADKVWHQFIYDRPRGTPAVIAAVGEAVMVRDLATGADSSRALRSFVDDVVPKILREFATEAGEIIAFVEGERVTFGSFSHQFEQSEKLPDFPGLVGLALDLLERRMKG